MRIDIHNHLMSVAFIEHLIGCHSLSAAHNRRENEGQAGSADCSQLGHVRHRNDASQKQAVTVDRDQAAVPLVLPRSKITGHRDVRKPRVSHSGSMNKSQTFILIHGSWQGAWSWNGVRDRLRTYGHRVITPTLPGRGDVSEDRSWIGHDDNVAAVLAALDVDDSEVILGSHSLGGVVASQVADRRPERIARLVYCGAFVLEDGESAGDVMPEQMRTAIHELSDSRPDRAIPMPWALWRANFMQTASEDFARATFARLVPDAYRPVFEPIHLRRPVHRELPTSFLAFNQDQTMPAGYWHPGMSGRLVGDSVVEIEGDHELPLTGPDRLADALHRLGAA
jgi:pimeloyl-ACP methyl ester carboxylesterase